MTMITPSYLGETIEYSSLHACRSTLEDPTYGVLIARNPSHNRGFTMAGLLMMAFFGGIGGGVSRDMLLNDIPSPLKDPTYLFVCLLMGLLGLAICRYLESKEERFRTRTLAFFKSFTLPWFAILGAHKALEVGSSRVDLQACKLEYSIVSPK